jgi:hypothetical protein
MANQVLYGFYNLTELGNERVTPANYDVVNSAINATVAEHNRQMMALNSLFVQRTTQYKIRYQTAQSARLQPLDNNGRARPILPVGNYDLAFPIQSAGSAWGANRVARVKMTIAEVQRAVATMLDADMRWMRDHILGALYTNVSWSYTDPLYGALTVMPLANADSTTYMLTSGSDAGATDTAFGAQSAGIADATNPFPTIYTELMEHPENGGEVISFIPTNLVATTEALATYKAVMDPNVQLGANTAALVGSLNTPIPGVLRGYADKNWIVEWRSLPDNYIISVTTGGEKPVAMREEPEVELQGFKKVAERNDHPFFEDQWERRAGFGAYNRVGAFITRIGNASYAIPTSYTSPMP